MTPQRRRLYTIIMLAFPFLLLLGTEAGLRFMGFGPDLSLFTTEVLNGKTYHIMNPAVKYRYFSRVEFAPSTSPDYFLVPKPAGTYRIFCLGASTTVGFPYWYNASFTSFMRDRLTRLFPDRRIEVINLGMTATNSYTALDITREVMAYEPDMLVVYDGHNEFYGALGVASHESMGGASWLSRLSLRLVHIRLFQAARAAYALAVSWFGSDDPGTRGTMMEKLARGRTIPIDSDLYRAGLDVFRTNLEDIRVLCSKHNIPVLFGTQVSNLRGHPPFISADATALAPGSQLEFHRAFNAGMTQAMNGMFDSALVAFRSAEHLLPLHAETHFRIAWCLDTLGRKSEARTEYVRARDLDELRFRTSSDFNAALLAMDDGAYGVGVDMEQMFAAHSPDSIIGNELVLEHLHPTSYGQFLIARAYVDRMRERGLIADSDVWASRDTVADAALWADRHVTEVDERMALRRTEVLITAWPFQEEEGLVSAIAATDTLGAIADRATRGQIHWRQLHELAIEHYATRNDMLRIEREYRTIISQFPAVDVEPYLYLAHLLLNQNRIPEVEATLHASLGLKPTILAYRALGDIALRTSRPAEAVTYYEKIFTFPLPPPEQVENGHLLAAALYSSGQRDLALQRVLHVLSLRPDYRPAVELLAEINKQR
jgi:tetratricopeptide (TPR) repeat protein